MHTYTDQLMALSKRIPGTAGEQDLPLLEELATEFQHILKQVHNYDARHKTNTQYYYERVKSIESALFDGKYAHDQKRRESACRKARQELASGIEALTALIKDSTSSPGQ